MTPITRPAHAKVNVFLRVLGPRPDGYHEVESLVLPISLHDDVVVEAADDLSITVSGPTASGAPDDERNLAFRAARLLGAEAGGPAGRGARIVIEKRIPVAAGLGGGSADAAATLRALDELWALGSTAEELAELALRTGSDVPALLRDEPVYVRGRGELIDPVLVQPTTWVVKPFGFRVSSADAYAWWDERAATGPDPGALVAAAESGNDALLGSALFNDLQGPVAARHPEISGSCDALVRAGAHGAVMSGSGPTVVALCSFASAEAVAEAVEGAFVVDAPPRPPAPGRIGGTEQSGVV